MSYVPGVCNIGREEEGVRVKLGWLGVGVTVLYAVVLFIVQASPLARLAIILPAAFAASGFIQAKMHFCAGFAAFGVYRFDDLDEPEKIIAKDAHRADMKKALRIAEWSVLAGIPVGVIAALI